MLDVGKLKQDTTNQALEISSIAFRHLKAHHFNKCRNPNRRAVPSYCCYAMIEQSLHRGRVQPSSNILRPLHWLVQHSWYLFHPLTVTIICLLNWLHSSSGSDSFGEKKNVYTVTVTYIWRQLLLISTTLSNWPISITSLEEPISEATFRLM